MIKKVSSWILSSFFRQVGRFLFFLVLGGLVFLLIQHNDIDFKLTDLLGIEMVKADTYVRGVDTPWKNNSGTLLSKNGAFHYINKMSCSTQNCGYEVSEFYLNSAEQVNITSIKGGTIEIPFYVSATIPIANANQQLVCPTWVPVNGGYSCSGFTTAYSGQIQLEPTINFWTMVVYNNGYTDMCTIDSSNNKIRCPIAQMSGNDKIWFIQVRTQVYYGDNYPAQQYTVGLGDKINLFKNDFIGLQENNTQNIQDINNTLTDTNTTNETNETTSFFNSTHSSSEGILSSIVSAPLTLLNNLASGTYNDICATLNGKNICLPSGGIIWNRDHTAGTWFRGGTTQAFIDFFNLVVGGFVLYKCLASLFYSVHTLLDPTKTWVEVMKL